MFLLLACTGARPEATPPLSEPADTATAPCTAWGYADATPLELGAWVPGIDVQADCTTGEPAAHLEDLTGDSHLDIVITDRCDDEAVGRDYWEVLPGRAGGFDAGVEWSLPAGFGAGAFDQPRDAADCTTDADLPAWFAGDMDGDGHDDIVVTESCVDATPASGIWSVYPAEASGFGAEIEREIDTRWGIGTFTHPRATSECADGLNMPAWNRLDLDGDGRLDVVLTRSCVDPAVGVTSWELLRNDGATFTPAEWPIVGALSMSTTERTSDSCADFFLLDVDGDARPEVIGSENCLGDGSLWDLSANTGAGFAQFSSRQGVPWGLSDLLDRAERRSAACPTPAWVFDDADADGWTDLTLTTSCTDPSVGDTHWAFWPGTPTGWDTPVPWALPTSWSSASFGGSGGGTLACSGTRNVPRWTRRDLDADGRPEIIVTQSCDAPDATRWLVHSPTCLDG